MGQLLVRNLSDDTIAFVKARAAQHGRSVEAEHRAILDAVAHSATSAEAKAAWFAEADRLREALKGRDFTPSEDIMRELREET